MPQVKTITGGNISEHIRIRITAIVLKMVASALKVFGQAGVGIFAMPSVIEAEVKRQYDVQVIGRVDAVHERFYAISVERKLRHPAVVAMYETVRQDLFHEEGG